MTSRLDVAVVQQRSSLDPDENRRLVRELTPTDSDLVVFPEAFACDFGQAGRDLSESAEPTDGPFARTVEAVAAERSTTVVAGMFELTGEGSRPWNTLLVRGDATADYRKIHLYDSFGYRESDTVGFGPLTPAVVRVGGLTLGLMTCYDLRFPELARALADQGIDAIVLSAAWLSGPRKVEHWRTLIRARAIENTVYVIAAGQPAPAYSGHSMIVDPWGEVLAEAGDDDEIIRATITEDVVKQVRATNPSLANRRL